MNQHINARTIVSDQAMHQKGPLLMIRALQIASITAEILLIAHALAGNGWELLATGHLAIVGLLTLTIIGLERAQVETGPLQVFTLLTFASGPIGAGAALLGEQQMWQPRGDALAKWYDTIAPAETPAVTLVDMIIDGRLVREQSRLPRPYDALLSSGTMQEKQALLAYLAIEDDEKFVEVALALALRSPDQRVRVQAAAVAAHTRARSRRRHLSGINVVQAALAQPAAV